MGLDDKSVTPRVNAHNEWDPLEEIIVGILHGGANRAWETQYFSTSPPEFRDQALRSHAKAAGTRTAYTEGAKRQLEEFVHILEGEGVVVRRPEPVDHARPFATQEWSVPGGMGQVVPRDFLVVIGDEIIEAAQCYRWRYFEFRGYRKLIKEYFQAGARWTAAPKPELPEELYEDLYGQPFEPYRYATNEYEPVFDAADIMRCGRDIFIQRSHVTNESGIKWLRRHLGDTYRVHKVEFRDERAVHIDATFSPLAPGKVLVNPDRPIRELPAVFKDAGWDFLECPRTVDPRGGDFPGQLAWLHMNVLMLDEKRVVVERDELPLIAALRDWGFKPIPVAFRECYPFGGAFHCYTCDVRRRGTLQSYF